MKTIFALFMCVATPQGRACSGPTLRFDSLAACAAYKASYERSEHQRGIDLSRTTYACMKAAVPAWSPAE